MYLHTSIDYVPRAYINSLGDRLKDIVIPIKKDLQKSKNISEMVKQSIENNRRAKELSKKSKESILA